MEETARLSDLIRRVDADEKPSSPAIVAAHGCFVWDVIDGAVTSVKKGAAFSGATDYAAAAHMALQQSGAVGFDLVERTCAAVAGVTSYVRAPWVWLATDGTGGGWE